MKSLKTLTTATLGLSVAGTAAHGAIATEHWDYAGKADATQVTAANDFQGGTGWSGEEWLQIVSNGNVDYSSAGNLTSSVTGYQNGNAVNSGGLFGAATQGNSDKGVYRQISGSALTGTVYVSFLFANNNLNGVQTSVFIRDTDAGTQGLGFRAESGENDAGLAWGTSDNGNLYSDLNEQGTQYAFAEGDGNYNSVNLVILKFETDYATTLDRVTMYLNPTDVTTEALAASTAAANLTTGGVSVVSGSDIWGSSLTAELAAHTRTGGAIDQIRVAYGDDGFAGVTTIPEPASLALIGFGTLCMLGRRRLA